MQIGKDLRLVIPVAGENGPLAYVFAQAVSREVFERYYFVIARAFNQVYTGGLGQTAAPRVAAMLIRDTAKSLGQAADVEQGLMTEIRRLATVATPGPSGWQSMPIDDAVSSGVLDSDDLSEVENALAFFTLAWSMHSKSEREPVLKAAMGLWGGQLTSSSFTEFLASLPTSTATANSGETTQASSVPT